MKIERNVIKSASILVSPVAPSPLLNPDFYEISFQQELDRKHKVEINDLTDIIDRIDCNM